MGRAKRPKQQVGPITHFLNITAITVVTIVCVVGTIGLFWGFGWAISKRFF